MCVESQTKLCKICLSEDESDENFFCNPCDCKGSCEFVHFECLKNWIQSKVKCKKGGDTTSVYSWKKSGCEICNKPFPKHIRYQNKLNNILDIEIPDENPYIILESIAKEKKVVKTLFVFSTNEEDTEIKLGRGHQCEVRISDISVSRIHSMIKYKEGKFNIFDSNSKFGTLIKINESFTIASDKKALQIGRTVITFAQKIGQTGAGNTFLERTESLNSNQPTIQHAKTTVIICPPQQNPSSERNGFTQPLNSQTALLPHSYMNQFISAQYNGHIPHQQQSQQINPPSSQFILPPIVMSSHQSQGFNQISLQQLPSSSSSTSLQMQPPQFQQYPYQYPTSNSNEMNQAGLKQNKGNNRQL